MSARTVRLARQALTAAAATGLLAACGGGGTDGDDGVTEEGRGGLLEASESVGYFKAGEIDLLMKVASLDDLTGAAKCDVEVYQLNYRTVGVNQEETNASAALLVPVGDCENQAFPLVAYAKGTDVEKPRTLADPTQSETVLLAALYAAQGYVVVATDYLGYAKSSYAYHPYLHADSEATSVIDSIRAARYAADRRSLSLSGRVMLTGYSQGGHSSMAAQRAIERDNSSEFNVVASAHLAGPYNLSGALRQTEAVRDYQFFVPFLVTAWQKVYGTIYSTVAAAFKQPYADYIETLLPSDTLTFETLVSEGKLPGGDGVTPNQARDLIFQDSFIAASRTDEASGIRQAAKKNDLLSWTPRTRTLLCGGSGDPTVLTSVHQVVAQAAFSAQGLSHVTSVDVDSSVRSRHAPDGTVPIDPASEEYETYYSSYHGTYEPPICGAQARAVFETVK